MPRVSIKKAPHSCTCLAQTWSARQHGQGSPKLQPTRDGPSSLDGLQPLDPAQLIVLQSRFKCLDVCILLKAGLDLMVLGMLMLMVEPVILQHIHNLGNVGLPQ